MLTNHEDLSQPVIPLVVIMLVTVGTSLLGPNNYPAPYESKLALTLDNAPRSMQHPVSGRSIGQPVKERVEEDKAEEIKNKIVIHVCDEARKVNKDFECDKIALVTQMKYFENLQLSGSNQGTALEDLEIAVHCDVKIFEWLMKYLQNPQAQAKELEVNTVISILISAEYLQMPKLIDECIQFVRNNINDVKNLRLDMNCISDNTLKKLALSINLEELDEIEDKKNKLLTRIYTKKLTILLDDDNNNLSRCIYCNKLFTASQRSWMVCPKACGFIDFHGTVIAEHVADRYWDTRKFLVYLRQSCGLTYKEIYYKIWSHLITLHCGECDQNFVGAEIAQCAYHSQKARFGSGSNNGAYLCCGAPAIRFDTALRTDGCTAKNHTLANSWKTVENVQLYNELIKRHHIIAEPFIGEHRYSEQYKILEKKVVEGRLALVNNNAAIEAISALPLSAIKDSPALQVFIQMYANTFEDCRYSESEDEDEDEIEEINRMQDKKKKDKAGKGRGDSYPSQQVKSWRLDALRNDDRIQMQNIVKELKRFRGDAPAPVRKVAPSVSQSSTSTAFSRGNTNNAQQGPRAMPKRQSTYIN